MAHEEVREFLQPCPACWLLRGTGTGHQLLSSAGTISPRAYLHHVSVTEAKLEKSGVNKALIKLLTYTNLLGTLLERNLSAFPDPKSGQSDEVQLAGICHAGSFIPMLSTAALRGHGGDL